MPNPSQTIRGRRLCPQKGERGLKILERPSGPLTKVSYRGYTGYIWTANLKYSVNEVPSSTSVVTTTRPVPVKKPAGRPSGPTGTVVTRSGANLRIRTKPTQSGGKTIGVIPNGTEGVVVTGPREGRFVPVSYKDSSGDVKNGYVWDSNLKRTSSLPSSSPELTGGSSGSSAKPVSQASTLQKMYPKVNNCLNFRKTRSKGSSNIISCLTPSEELEIMEDLGSSGEMVKAKYNGIDGYVSKKFLTTKKPETESSGSSGGASLPHVPGESGKCV